MTTNYDQQLAAIRNDRSLSNDEKFQKELELWYNWQDELGSLKAAEMSLRKDIFARCFPNPVEGSDNKYDLVGGWIVQGKYPIDRKIDTALLTNYQAKFDKAGIKADIIRWKPELSVTEYKKLTDKQKELFDNVLIIKPGSPSLEVKKPKRV
jgi:hypothetical protein